MLSPENTGMRKQSLNSLNLQTRGGKTIIRQLYYSMTNTMKMTSSKSTGATSCLMLFKEIILKELMSNLALKKTDFELSI